MAWTPLHIKEEELLLSHTLPIGQTFRWVETQQDFYTGIIGSRAYQLEQLDDSLRYRVIARGKACEDDSVDREEDLQELKDYFQLDLKLADFISHWSSCDERFKAVKDYYPGARLLRQDPVECLFSFICSSNNNIKRIHGMVNSLCRLYGSELELVDDAHESQQGEKLFMFPTLEQLSNASEETLRANGFGYRAKFITGSVKALNEKEEGGHQWLMSLRDVPYKEAATELMTLPGIGPKVAACICLFSLDKYEAIPVDTHVWQLVTTHYRTDLKKKTLTPRLMDVVENTLIDKFGPHAGWAHNILFLAELADLKKRLPEKLQTPPKRKPAKGESSPKKKAKKKIKMEAKSEVKSEVKTEVKREGE